MGQDLIDRVIFQWDNYKIFTNWFKKLFWYLDENTLKFRRTSIVIISYQSFIHSMKSFFQGKLFDTIYEFLKAERSGDTILRPRLYKVIQVWCFNEFIE